MNLRYADAGHFFSLTYGEARSRFFEAASRNGALLAEYRNPHASGPCGENLCLDTAWIGPEDAESVLLNTSGTHGAEGFAGSAAQLAWLTTQGVASLPRNTAMLMVHAVNPFGFAWGLRGTENNVDLNRNFIDPYESRPENPLYEKIHGFLCPKSLNDPAMRTLLGDVTSFVETHGQWAMEDALSRGQYTHPDGYHYGGAAPEWSHLTMRRIMETQLQKARRIGFIDWHSGPAGNGELIYLCFSKPDSPERTRAIHWWGRDALNPETVDSMWGSKRPTRRGVMFWGLEAQLFPRTLTGAVIEFRSASHKPSAAASMRACLTERWLRFEAGLQSDEAAQYYADIRNDYAPERPSWRENVIRNALQCYKSTLRGMDDWGRERAYAAD